MKVNFNICNHAPAHIQDFVDYIAAGVEDLGLPFVITDDIQPDAINVMLDGFEEPRVADQVERTRRRHPDTPFVIMATEVMQDSVFNSGGWREGIRDASPYSQMDVWSRRTSGFRRLALAADAILCPSELLYASYLEHRISDRLHYLPLVHFDRFAPEPAVRFDVEEDIDVLFTGVLTSHREQVLRLLERRGFAVAVLPVTAPEYIRHHFMRRAKVYVALKHFDDTRTLSKMRVYWALSHGYYCIAEAGTDPTDLDEVLQWYSSVEDIADAVSLDRATRHALAADRRERFRARSTVNPFAAPFAPWLPGSGDAGALRPRLESSAWPAIR